MSKIINWYPDAPNTLLWRNHDLQTKREFFPSVSIRFEDMPEWHECTNNYKEGYELLWSLRQEEHTAEEQQSLEAQYAAWQSSNPALAEEIDHAVPIKPEQEPTIHLEPTEPSPEPSESEPISGVVEREQESEQATPADEEGGEG